jgi:hypothetical protein
MKPTAICLVLLCAPALMARAQQPAENRPQQPAATQEYTRATPAPQLGHPLDPADVDVLTGKTKAPGNAGYRVDSLSYAYGSDYGYAARGRGYAGFGRGRSPLLIGRMPRGSFFFFGNPRFFAPRPFFFGLGRGAFFF